MPEDKPIRINDDRLNELGQALQSRLARQMERKRRIEERWLEDIRQYHGRYSIEIENILTQQEDQTGSSSIFVNLTRVKCDTAEARVADMLFPTDDRNWTLGPTPEPDLATRANSDQPILDPNGAAIGVNGQPVTEGELANAEMDAAKDAARAMQTEIDDQLNEAKYAAISRDAIRDATQVGSGIIKGPIIVGRSRKAWVPIDDGTYELKIERDRRPAVRRVSPWDFYPDMSATDIDDAEYFYEREKLTRKQVRRLADRPGYMRDRIKRVLEDDSHRKHAHSGDDVQQRLREIADIYDAGGEDAFYEHWTYTGPVDREFLEAAGLKKPGVFDEMEVEVHFIGATIIKLVQMPLETDEHSYSVFNWIKTDGSIFGFGIPYVMRASQEITNKSWRAQLDNAALSVGPQVVADAKSIEPTDGVWSLTARKTWWKKDQNARVNDVFGVFNISSFQPELQSIFNTARELADEETALPKLAQGEMGNMPKQTATGMSMLINASNVFLRRVIKNWDDDVTVPLITRFYDYNMQYNSKPEIKGDFEVNARGASTLMVKETQTQALLSLMTFANDPTFGPMTKAAELYRRVVEAQRLNPDDIILSDEEIEQRQQAAQQPGIEEQKLALEQQKLQLEAQKAQQESQLKLLELSVNSELTIEQLQAKIQEVVLKEQSESERQDQEAAIKLVAGSGL